MAADDGPGRPATAGALSDTSGNPKAGFPPSANEGWVTAMLASETSAAATVVADLLVAKLFGPQIRSGARSVALPTTAASGFRHESGCISFRACTVAFEPLPGSLYGHHSPDGCCRTEPATR